MDKEQLEQELKKAYDGLLMMSETDEPFEYYYTDEFSFDELDEDKVRKLAGMPADYPMETVELSHFFRNMTREGSDEYSKQQASRFRKLEDLLQDNLENIKVYRIGEVRLTALILGKTKDGHIAGLKTVLVET